VPWREFHLPHLIPGETCAPVAVIQASLRSEGQVRIAEGFLPSPDRPREIFTSNINRSLGYNISYGTASRGDEGIACVGDKFTDIHLNTDPNFARQPWANVGPSNSSFNQYLSSQETRVRAQVIMGATSLVRGTDGQERRGALVRLVRGFGNPSVNNQGVFVTASQDGARYGISSDLVNIEPNETNFRQLAMAQDNERPPQP
jgi:hypothetical protein